MTDSSRYGTSLFTSPGVITSAGMPHALAWEHRRRSSIIRSGVRATSMPPLWVDTPSSRYWAGLSSVSSNIILEYSMGKMKFEAWPVEPPGLGIGPLSTSTRSRQPSRARWWTRLLPTMPAPMMTALARAGISVMLCPHHGSSRQSLWVVGSGARQGGPPPLLGLLKLVEGEQVQSGHARAGGGQGGGGPVQHPVRAVAAGDPEAQDPAGVPGDEPGRLGRAGHRGHPQQPGAFGRAGQPHVQRQGDAAGPDPLDPPGQAGRVEAHVAHDVGRVPALVPHGLDGDVVVDLGVALRVPGDPGPGERAT